MNCPECATANRASNTFCDDCGAILVESDAPSGQRRRTRLILLGCLFLVAVVIGLALWIAGQDGDPLEDAATTPDGETCCRVCRAGRACGDSCIAKDETCERASGCACQGPACERVCRKGKACGDTCIASDATCSEPPGSACNADE